LGGAVLKRILLILTGLFLLIYLPGCSSSGEQGIFGVYEFKKVSYLSPLSSSMTESLNRTMKGTKYIVSEDLFKIESIGHTVEYESPKYVKENIPGETSLLSDVRTFIGKDVEYQYTVYTKNGIKTRWRLYVSSDRLWIANYTDNTENGSEIIMYIYELSK